MSNKTPYEIRLEVLQMAKDYMDTAQAQQVKLATDLIAAATQLQSSSVAEIQQLSEKLLSQSLIPTNYTPDALVKQATEFLSFINNNKG